MMATVADTDSPSQSGENDEETDKGTASDEGEPVRNDNDTQEEEEVVCCCLRLDHRVQRTLFQVADEVDAEEAAADVQSLSQNIRKFMEDLCGWVPDQNVQYRRPAAGKHPPKASRTTSKLDAGSASRRLAHSRNVYGQNQTAANTEFEFKHFSNYKKYSEQYRRFNTCGGPLQKLTQSAYGGRPRTIYYAGDATADAGVQVNTSSSGTAQQTQPRTGPGLMSGTAIPKAHTRVAEKPSSNSQPTVSYSDISVNSPRYNLLADTSIRKNRTQYPRMEWSHHPDGGQGFSPYKSGDERHHTGNQPPGQWNVSVNEETLTVYTSKPPGSLPAPNRPATPPKPHLPFFPSQQPLKQLHKSRTSSLTPPIPCSNPVTSDTLPNGYSLDRSLGSQAGYLTGISPNPLSSHRNFYSQLMHAAHYLSMTAKSPKDFEFSHWPMCNSHSENQTGTSSLQHTSHQGKPSKNQSPSLSHSNNVQVQIKGRGVRSSPTLTHQTSKSSSRSIKEQTHSLGNPTAATTSGSYTETHYITIEAPTSAPFETRSCLNPKIDSEDGIHKTSYRVTLKDKPPVSDLKEKTSVDMIADANRPLAVCEVAWF